MNDVSFGFQEGRFSYRVGALIIHSGKILLTKNENSAYFYTPGGRVHLGETAHEAILREVFEETDTRMEIEKLAYINENFFVLEDSGESYHELCLFFAMKYAPPQKMVNYEEYGAVHHHWIPIDGLKDVNVYPIFLRNESALLPQDVPKYIITRGDDSPPSQSIHPAF